MGPARSGLVFLHTSDELYGADRILLELLDAVSHPSDVVVWLPNDLQHPENPLCTRLEDSGYSVRHLDMPILRRAYLTPTGLLGLASRAHHLRRELRKVRPRVAYCTTSAAFLSAAVARLTGVPVVIGHAQEMWSAGDRRLLGVPGAFCHQLISISEAVRGSLPRRLRARTRVLPNATHDPGPVSPLSEHEGDLVFVVASRWSARKGLGTLLAAWSMAETPGRLVILGGPPPTGAAVDVRRMVDDLNLSDSVTVVGEVPNTSSYLVEADIVLVPSDLPEGFGLVAIEAFARGRPVVASAHGGILEVVTPDVNGWLFPPGDSLKLSKLLRELTRAEASEAGSRARETFEKNYTVERLSRNWNKLVPEIASR